jgi:hypothetical protein
LKESASNVVSNISDIWSGIKGENLNVQFDRGKGSYTNAFGLSKLDKFKANDDDKAKAKAILDTLPSNITGKDVIEEYILRKLKGEDITSEKFFSASGEEANEKLAEDIGKGLDEVVKAIRENKITDVSKDQSKVRELIVNKIKSNPKYSTYFTTGQ